MTKNNTRRQAETADHSPVSLPAASFDLDKLAGGLDKAVNAGDDREKAVKEALVGALPEGDDATVARLEGGDPSDQAGFVKQDVEHETIEGLTETVRVFDPAKAAEQAPDQPLPNPPAAGETEKGE